MYKNKKSVFIIFTVLALLVASFSYFLAKYHLATKEEHKETQQQPSEPVDEKEVNIDDEHTITYRFDFDYEKESLENILDTYLNEKHLDDEIAISYYNFTTKETYHHQQDTYMFAASTYKLPLNMYIDELIAQQAIDANALITFDEADIEDDESYYKVGSQIPLSKLQYNSIVYSDNNASNALFNYLGGWTDTLDAISKYSNMPIYDNYENYFTTQYMLDALRYLYENEAIFTNLISNMKKATPKKYLQKYVHDVAIAHKYGNYGSVQNDVGIVYCDTPYAIAIFSNTVSGEKIIGEINRIFYEYTLTKKKVQ